MIAEISVPLYHRKYRWKPSSLQFIRFGYDEPGVDSLDVSFALPNSLDKRQRVTITLQQTD
eukprot:3122142-Pyramimonas_sp.AAC.1